jgi:hypothetical protein
MQVNGIGDKSLKIEGFGSITILLSFKNRTWKLTLLKVFWGPSIARNIISGSLLDKSKHSLKIKDSTCLIYNPYNQVIAIAPLKENLYILNSRAEDACLAMNINTRESPQQVRHNIMMWHRRYGHQNAETIKKMASRSLVHGLENIKGEITTCDTCIKSKMTRAGFKKSEIRTKNPLDLLHMDLWSSSAGPSFGQNKYLLTIVDDYSRYAWVFPLKNKNQSLKTFKTFKSEIENQTGRKIKTVRTDNGLEFCSHAFSEFLQEVGIQHQRHTAQR